MSHDGWCTIESDPAVFTEMIDQFGASGVAVEEVISVDEASLAALGKIYGLVLLFKWKPGKEEAANTQPDSQVYFAQQIVQNACATQAIINILLNHPEEITLGAELTNFLEFTQQMDARTRGEMIGESATLRQVHNSFTRSTVFSFEDKQAKEDDDVYHFIAYTMKNNALWELDGLQNAPILIGDVTEASFLEKLSATVMARMEKVSTLDTTGQGQGISFSLLAVVNDKLTDLENQIALLQSEEKPTGYLENELADVTAQREKGKEENKRRRHNYIPGLVELFKCLQEKGKLEGIVDKSKARHAERVAARKENKK